MEEREERQFKTLLFASYIKQRGSRYRDCRLQNFRLDTKEQFDAMERIKNWMEGIVEHVAKGRSVIMSGNVGSGKDHLITGMVHESIKSCAFRRSREDTIVWTHGPRMFSASRDAIADAETEKASRRPYTAARLLIISDVVQAGHSLTEHQRTVLYDIIDHRYSHCRPTWLTTNASDRKSLVAAIGADVTDRLMDSAFLVTCSGNSARRPSHE